MRVILHHKTQKPASSTDTSPSNSTSPANSNSNSTSNSTTASSSFKKDEEDDVKSTSVTLPPVQQPNSSNTLTSYATYSNQLTKQSLKIHAVQGDGNCLFRAVSIQVYGDEGLHEEVREKCLDFMAGDRDHFGGFCAGESVRSTSSLSLSNGSGSGEGDEVEQQESFQDYIARKRKLGTHGNNPEIQAISELYARRVEIYTPDTGGEKAINIFQCDYGEEGDSKDQDEGEGEGQSQSKDESKTPSTKSTKAKAPSNNHPIRLSYEENNHYNAILNPFLPTAGLGLGLPNLEIGLADKMQMEKAVEESVEVNEEKERGGIDFDLMEAVKSESRTAHSKNSSKENENELERTDEIMRRKIMEISDWEATEREVEMAILESSRNSSNGGGNGGSSWGGSGGSGGGGSGKRRRNNNSNNSNSSSSGGSSRSYGGGLSPSASMSSSSGYGFNNNNNPQSSSNSSNSFSSYGAGGGSGSYGGGSSSSSTNNRNSYNNNQSMYNHSSSSAYGSTSSNSNNNNNINGNGNSSGSGYGNGNGNGGASFDNESYIPPFPYNDHNQINSINSNSNSSSQNTNSSTSNHTSTSSSNSSNTNQQASNPSNPSSDLADQYPPLVQELVMNGYELNDVLRGYEFVGDDFNGLVEILEIFRLQRER